MVSPAPSSSSDPLVLLGEIVAPHGVRGEVRVRSFTADPLAIGQYGALYDAAGSRRFVLRPRFISRGAVIARIEGIDDRNAAEALRGTQLHVRRSALPATGGDEYYLADLVGLAVETVDGRVVGQVKAVHNFGAGDVIEIAPPEGDTTMLPFTRRHVPVVDVAAGRVVIQTLDASSGPKAESTPILRPPRPRRRRPTLRSRALGDLP